MSFLAPLLAIFGISVPAIIVLYILKIRRRDVVVPSTLLWRGDAVDRQASVPCFNPVLLPRPCADPSWVRNAAMLVEIE